MAAIGDGAPVPAAEAAAGEEADHESVAAAASRSPSRSRALSAAAGENQPGRARMAIGDGVPAAQGTANEEAENDEVASTPSRSLALHLALATAAGDQARRAPMAASSSSSMAASSSSSTAASSSSASLPAPEGSESPSRPWVLLWRAVRAYLAGAAADAQAQARHAAAAPDLTLPLPLPPHVAVVSAGPGADPDPRHPDELPFLLVAANRGLLIEFGANTLMLARHFHRNDGHTMAILERVVDRPDDVPVLTSLESVVFSSTDMGEYQIAELQVDDDSAKLVFMESGSKKWSFRIMERPPTLDLIKNRKWIANGSTSDDKLLWWFDLSWGILSLDSAARDTDELTFHELPDHRILDQAPPDIHHFRTIAVSQQKLRFVEIDAFGTLMMWTRDYTPSGCDWIKTYKMRFQELWSSSSFQKTMLPQEVPLLCVVCPTSPNFIYFALGQQVFGVNLLDLTIAHDGRVIQLVDMPWVLGPVSSRYIIAWDLPTSIIEAKDEKTLPINQEECNILSVWRNNCHAAFHQIQNLMEDKEVNWVIGLDTEFCPRELPPPPWTSPPFGDESYRHMRHSVDEGNLIQVGIAITKLDYPHEIFVFEFNIHFDPTSRPENSEKVAFLRKINFPLEKHASNGIFIDDFIVGLNKCGVLNNKAVTWITYQGFSDFAYLLRGIERGHIMPESRRHFLNSVERLFPKNYDLKTFHHMGLYCDKSERGKANFEALALCLGAERTGKAHTAGSDALLTVCCFTRMLARELPFRPMLRLQGNLFRMTEIVPHEHELPANYDRYVSVVNVDSRNFQSEGKRLQKIFPMYGIISAEIHNYGTASQDLRHMTAVEVVIVISDPHGWPAHGKMWKFNLKNEDNSISSMMLADLLKRIGAISKPAVTWISSEVALFQYLLKACTTAPLPDETNQLNTICSGFFPNLYIVPSGPEDESQPDPASKVIATLRRFLLRDASSAQPSV